MASSLFNRGRRTKLRNKPKKLDKDRIITKIIPNVIGEAENECSPSSSVYNDNKINYYNFHDKGPFYVHVEGDHIDAIKIGEILTKANIHGIVGINKINKKNVKIQTVDGNSANKILKCNKFETNYKVFIPDFYIKSTGVIRGIPTDMDINDMKNYSKCHRGNEQIIVDNFERIQRWNKDEKKTRTNQKCEGHIQMPTLTKRNGRILHKSQSGSF